MGEASSSVPCDGCTLCCKGQKVFLFDDEDATGLGAVPDIVPDFPGRPGRRALRLPLTAAGDCAHLTDHGCAIYERRPRVCRGFDCRAHYFLPANERRKREAMFSDHDRAICRRGRELVEQARRG